MTKVDYHLFRMSYFMHTTTTMGIIIPKITLFQSKQNHLSANNLALHAQSQLPEITATAWYITWTATKKNISARQAHSMLISYSEFILTFRKWVFHCRVLSLVDMCRCLEKCSLAGSPHWDCLTVQKFFDELPEKDIRLALAEGTLLCCIHII